MHGEAVRKQNAEASAAGRAQGETYRLRVAYSKGDRLAYLGHLEVVNTMLTSIRRSRVPFVVGNGFTRRVRVQFSQALPVGASSACEYYDLMLTERRDPDEMLSALAVSTPPALAPYECAYVDRKLPALEAWLDRSGWQASARGEGLTAAGLDEAIGCLADKGELTYQRAKKEKTVDLRACLVSWTCSDAPDGSVALELHTRSTNLCSLRPAILVDAALKEPPLAGASLEALRVRRVAQCHEREDGALIDAFGNDHKG